ncbi:hypothetical protein Hamer_G011201 [Homarus americanus]|uniref:Kazal-like domain-containing protein n=1 Tax=Homarus americanus TaxID=6706 RepID=A0A8J5JXN4_HOMAM|nr:hypothetical protein Hamer_G011201 [Homarus americanus]
MSDCMLDNARCNDATLHLAYRGRCGDSQERVPYTLCLFTMTLGVTENNGKVYGNECQLNIAICNDPSLKPGSLS